MISRIVVTNFIISAVLVSLATGCETMYVLPATDAQSIGSQLTIGDTVRIVRKDASQTEFKIESISDDGINGADEFVAYTEILEAYVLRISTAKTIGLFAGIVLVMAVISGPGEGPPLP